MRESPKYSRDLPEERRRKLIEATVRCLAERGVAGTSLREICRRAGVSPGLVGHHFAGKEALIAETYAFLGETVERHLGEALADAGAEPDDRLDAFIAASFRPPILEQDLLAVWIGFWSLVRSDPSIFRLHRKVYAAYRERLEGLLAAAASKRGLAIDARLTAISLAAMLDGLWLEWCLDPETFAAEEASATVSRWLQRLWRDP